MAISGEKRREYDRSRYENDPVYRENLKARRRAYYEANKERIKARANAHRRNNPGRAWKMELKRRYGLSEEAWDQLLVSQSGRCAICSDPMQSPHVDHCHASSVVRGLLCPPCNTGLGHFRDDATRLQAAIDYLA